jgi:hypothetical protein
MKIHTLPSSPPFGIKEEDIQKCAYFLWKEEGSPIGRDLELWLAAKELLRHHAAVPHNPGRKNCASMAKKRGADPG